MSQYDHEFCPKSATPSAEAGYHVPSNLYKIGKACDEWLARRHALEGRRPAICQWRKTGTYRPPEPEKDAERAVKKLAVKVREHKKRGRPPITVPRYKAPRVYKTRQKKYASDEERRAAVAARVAAYWANMAPEKKAARVAVIKANRQTYLDSRTPTLKPAEGIPRHKDPKWLAYKREWERKRRKTHPLTEAQLEHRRAQARKNDRARRAKRKAEAAEAAAQAAKAVEAVLRPAA